MSSLNQNLKKYFVSKLIDVVTLLGFFVLLFLSLVYLGRINQYVSFAGLVVVFILLWFINSKISNWLEKWETPKMDLMELKGYNLIDTFLYGITAVLLVGVLWSYVNTYILLGVVVVGILFREIGKWRSYFKEKKNAEIPEREEIEDNDIEAEEEPPKKEEEYIATTIGPAKTTDNPPKEEKDEN